MRHSAIFFFSRFVVITIFDPKDVARTFGGGIR